MKISHNTELGPLTTFGVGGKARTLIECSTIADIREGVNYARNHKLPITVIGGGSNTLVHDDGFNGVVLMIRAKGINFSDYFPLEVAQQNQDESSVYVKAKAGEDWDNLVRVTVEKGLWGFENLSAIPGLVGASAIQNIGAYGVEVQSTIVAVECIDIIQQDLPIVTLMNEDCHFDYRHSIFKARPNTYIVTAVIYKLSKNSQPNISYPDVKNYFAGNMPNHPQEIRKAICEIRSKKLPPLNHYGTAGSFFKNPVISEEQLKRLQRQYPGLPAYPSKNGQYKISLAWLLDKVLHLNGYRKGNAEVYKNQPLVLAMERGISSSSADVYSLAQEIEEKCLKEFNITLEREVCCL